MMHYQDLIYVKGTAVFKLQHALSVAKHARSCARLCGAYHLVLIVRVTVSTSALQAGRHQSDN